MPAPVAKAYERVQSLVKHHRSGSLEEMQGAVEYLLDKIRIARGRVLNATRAFPYLASPEPNPPKPQAPAIKTD